MLVFWSIGAVMLLAALAFVLLPLLSARSSDPHAARRDALQHAHSSGVLDADEYREKLAAIPSSAATQIKPPRIAVAAVVVLLPLFAVFAYSVLGEPRALDPAASGNRGAMDAALADSADAAQAPDMNAAIASLAERMQREPDDLEGWMLLGRAYKQMERFDAARDALANAFRIAPDDADVMIEYAEAQVLASPTHRFEGEALALLKRAVGQNPEHQRGLLLVGVSAFQTDDFAAAAGAWERLVGLMPTDAPARPALLERIADARKRAGLSPLAQAPATASPDVATPPTPAASAGNARLTVSVDISTELRAKLAPDDVLFVFARAADGPRMPLAIQRLPASSLPTTVTLDDSTSMMPSMTLSSMPQVVVGARVSKSGEALPQPGDFETLSEPLPNTRTDTIQLTIDRVVP